MVARFDFIVFLATIVIIITAPLTVKRSINLFYSSSRFLLYQSYIIYVYDSAVGENTLQDSMHRITPDHKTVHRPAPE